MCPKVTPRGGDEGRGGGGEEARDRHPVRGWGGYRRGEQATHSPEHLCALLGRSGGLAGGSQAVPRVERVAHGHQGQQHEHNPLLLLR